MHHRNRPPKDYAVPWSVPGPGLVSHDLIVAIVTPICQPLRTALGRGLGV